MRSLTKLLFITIISYIYSLPLYPRKITPTTESVPIPKYLQERLIRLHAISMIVAWFLLILKGIFYMRYYKQFLRNKTFFGFEIWFQVHRIFNITAFILITISIVATFTANNFIWYGPQIKKSKSKTFEKWHSMIGVIAYLLIILQVLSSFFRCAPSKKNRIIFISIHRSFGITSFILALLNILIAVHFFPSLISNPTGAADVLYVYYIIILLCIISNEIHIRFKIRIGLLLTLAILVFSSLIVCIYLSVLICTSY
uniref:ascorbate ferrireductase (transmembrane) n=1 Tax=Parastrongyloides trichosuri TaxID=131310 RepID=A0A0N4Z4V9_PARTI